MRSAYQGKSSLSPSLPFPLPGIRGVPSSPRPAPCASPGRPPSLPAHPGPAAWRVARPRLCLAPGSPALPGSAPPRPPPPRPPASSQTPTALSPREIAEEVRSPRAHDRPGPPVANASAEAPPGLDRGGPLPRPAARRGCAPDRGLSSPAAAVGPGSPAAAPRGSARAPCPRPPGCGGDAGEEGAARGERRPAVMPASRRGCWLGRDRASRAEDARVRVFRRVGSARVLPRSRRPASRPGRASRRLSARSSPAAGRLPVSKWN